MIYILEDDDNIRKVIAYALKIQDIPCLDFNTPSLFWDAFQKEKPDLILLDIMLPEEDGITILKKIRKNPETSVIPVIMITARDTEFEMVSGLNAGADDYITKPFSMMTLVARIQAVLRRYENTSIHADAKESPLVAGEITLDPLKHTVFAQKKQIFLTVKEFDLLKLLMENKDTVVTREQLLSSIWDMDTDVESRTVDVHIRTLRHKLGPCGDNIETVRGVGFKLSRKPDRKSVV